MITVDIGLISAAGLSIDCDTTINIPPSYLVSKDEVKAQLKGVISLVDALDSQEYKFIGRLEISALLSCDKCLKEVFWKLSSDIFEGFSNENPENWPIIKGEFQPVKEEFRPTAGIGAKTPPATAALGIDPSGRPLRRRLSDTIDFMEVIRANTCALLPMKILCSDTCRGLCLICGKNLNKDSCGCEKPIDSKFAALSSFFKEEV